MLTFEKHSKHGEIKGAALIKDKELRSLIDFLSRDFNKFNFNGKTRDGTIINFNDIEELISYSNYKKRKLVTIEVGCSSSKKTIDIKFESDRFFFQPKSISYYLRYEEQDWGFRFEDDLRQCRLP